MQTPSHLLLTALAATGIKRRWNVPIHMTALLIGSVLPDLPFTVLTLAGEVYFHWFASLPVSGMSVMEYLHFDRFFNDPLWIVSHNLFHSLLINSVLIVIGWWVHRNQRVWGLTLFWLGISMSAHTVIDIFTHRSDGPLFLFPLSWTYRFSSPVSYWESAYFGQYFSILEWVINLSIVIYFVFVWQSRHKHHQEIRG